MYLQLQTSASLAHFMPIFFCLRSFSRQTGIRFVLSWRKFSRSRGNSVQPVGSSSLFFSFSFFFFHASTTARRMFGLPKYLENATIPSPSKQNQRQERSQERKERSNHQKNKQNKQTELKVLRYTSLARNSTLPKITVFDLPLTSI